MGQKWEHKCDKCGWSGLTHREGFCTRCYNKRRREKYILEELTWEECFKFIDDQLLRYKLKFSSGDADLSKIEWRFDQNGYAYISRKGKKVFLHHIVIERMFGYRPRKGSGFIIDHINRQIKDNTRDNLRIVDYVINARNCEPKPVGSKNSFTVKWSKGDKWQAIFRFEGKIFYCGLYNTRIEAHYASMSKRAAMGLCCEYANNA